jgi:hypothetical protein
MNHHPLEAAPLSSPFTATELVRLASYKAAVAAGFYTDALPLEAEAVA